MSLTYKESAVLFLNKSFIPVESDKVSNNGPSKFVEDSLQKIEVIWSA